MDGCNPGEVATAVERAVAGKYGVLTRDYMGKFRSLVFSLQDKDNWDLRTRVLLGRR